MTSSDNIGVRVQQALRQCAGFDGDEISRARVEALDYYFQRPRGDEIEGRAAVVSGDVSAMVEATLATMIEAFTTDQIAEFEPLDADDVQTQLESDVVAWYVMGRENGFLEIIAAIKEALLLRNGVVKVCAVDVDRRETRRLGDVAPEALAELLADDAVVAHDYDEATRELAVTTRVKRREFQLRAVSLENFVYDKEWHRPTLPGIPICAERHVSTRGELIALGFDAKKVRALPEYHGTKNTETLARDPKQTSRNRTSVDEMGERVEWFEAYAEVAAGDGAELRRVCIGFDDATVLDDKPVSRIPYAAGTAILNPHRFTGISLFDKLKQNQDERTALKRALYDNVNAVNKARLAGIDGVVNTDDVTDGRVNNMVRVKNVVQDVRQALMPIATQDTSANLLANLESSARARSEMGGAALDLQSAQLQIGGDRMGSQGLDRAYSVAEQLSAAMIKTLAATLIRDVFLLAHATLREYFDEPVVYKRRGKWMHATPSQWPERRSVAIKPGMSPGERTRRANALAEIISTQLMLTERGMDEVLVDLNGFNRALMDWSRLNDVQNPEQYFVDPESERAQAALVAKQRQAAIADQNAKALMQQAFGLEQLRTALAKYQGDADRQFQYFDAVLKSEMEEAKIAGSVTKDLIAGQRRGMERANGRSGDDTGERAQGAGAADT